MRRNAIVLSEVLFLLTVFGWAGWANWEYRQQEAEKRMAMMSTAELIPAADGGAPMMKSPLQGKLAPAFTLEDVNGKKVSLANYKGKALLINFWATWCGPCKIETPWLAELRNKYTSQGFEVLGVDSEGDAAKPGSDTWTKDKAAVTKFATQQKVPYPVLLYVDRKGVVQFAQVGIDSESVIEGNIKKILAK